MDLNDLQKLLSESAKKLEIINVGDAGSVDLTEEEKGVKHRIKIRGLSREAKIIKPRSNHMGFFKTQADNGDKSGKTGYANICDFCIFFPQDQGEIALIYCELKHTLDDSGKKKAEQQIRSTIPLARYILAGLEVHFHAGLRFVVKEHYVILTTREREENVTINKDETLLAGNKIMQERDVTVIVGEFPLPVADLCRRVAKTIEIKPCRTTTP